MAPEERAAWATAYRIYEEYVPKLRNAANDDDRAAEIFGDALDKVTELHNNSVTGSIMAVPLYEMLENAYYKAKSRERPLTAHMSGSTVRMMDLSPEALERPKCGS